MSTKEVCVATINLQNPLSKQLYWFYKHLADWIRHSSKLRPVYCHVTAETVRGTMTPPAPPDEPQVSGRVCGFRFSV